jgi:hypothetical protein
LTVAQPVPDFFYESAGTAFMLVTTTAPSLINLSVSPTSAYIGGQFTFSWYSPTGSTCAFFSQTESNFVAATGTLTVDAPGVAGTSADFFTCRTQLGDANTYTLLTVLTPVPTVTLSVSPSTISLGNSAILTWTSTGDADCAGNFSPGIVQNDSQKVTPTSTGVSTYTVTCTNEGGSATATALLTVTAAEKPTVAIAVSPTEIAAGTGTATLTWSSTGAPSCTASGAWSGTEQSANTSSIANLTAGQYVYTLTCTGPGGSASASATLKVDAAGGGGGGALSWWMLTWLSVLMFLRLRETRGAWRSCLPQIGTKRTAKV